MITSAKSRAQGAAPAEVISIILHFPALTVVSLLTVLRGYAGTKGESHGVDGEERAAGSAEVRPERSGGGAGVRVGGAKRGSEVATEYGRRGRHMGGGRRTGDD